jgi:hypothetical protein
MNDKLHQKIAIPYLVYNGLKVSAVSDASQNRPGLVGRLGSKVREEFFVKLGPLLRFGIPPLERLTWRLGVDGLVDAREAFSETSMAGGSSPIALSPCQPSDGSGSGCGQEPALCSFASGSLRKRQQHI